MKQNIYSSLKIDFGYHFLKTNKIVSKNFSNVAKKKGSNDNKIFLYGKNILPNDIIEN
jgi:hypothetical protein